MTPEQIAAASAETNRLSQEVDITNADHIALWLEANKDAGISYLAVQIVDAHEKAIATLLRNPPKHKFWGAGEPDCPSDLKARNGELHTLRCKVCGEENSANSICFPTGGPCEYINAPFDRGDVREAIRALDPAQVMKGGF